MTSEESIKDLDYTLRLNLNDKDFMIWNSIIKDLEILDMLKEYIIIDIDGFYIANEFYYIYDYPEEYFKIANFLNYKREPQEEDYEDDNYEKIKEWLDEEPSREN